MDRTADKNAVINADSLLAEIIRWQPALVTGATLNTAGGKDVGEFITGLRTQLIAMYKSVPR